MEERKSGELLTIKEQQQVMLDIMKAFHEFSLKNNISYILIYGTLLGAVRHKGFIPWDNDMDVGVPRPEYDRLVSLLNSGEKVGEHYYHLHYTNDNNYHYQIIRICDDRTTVQPPYIRNQPKRMGVWLDIFPIDGVPEKTLAGRFHRARLYINKKIQIADIYAVRGKKDIANRIGNIICHIFPNATKRNYKIDKILRQTPYEKSEYVGNMEDRDERILKMSKSFMEDRTLLKFEDSEFYGPEDWDGCLKIAYGDYMQLPPEDKRMSHPTGCKWI